MLMIQYEGEGKLEKYLGISDRVGQDNDFNEYGDGQKSWHLEERQKLRNWISQDLKISNMILLPS